MTLGMGAIERCLETLAAEVRADPALSSEFEGSIEAFFRGASPAGPGMDVAATLLAARRHLEWFLVEHHSAELRGSVAERLAERYEVRVEAIRTAESPAVATAMELALDALRRSHTGIFQVEEVRKGEGAWLRDLTGFGSFALGDAALSERLAGGELVVGRLYPVGDGLHVASPASAVLVSTALTKALQRDLDRIRGEGTPNIVRLNQAEIEAMFFGSGQFAPLAPALTQPATLPLTPDVVASQDPISDAIALLREAGFDDARARSSITRLAQRPRDPERLLHGGTDALGEILTEIAFDTDVDLAAAQKALLAAWEIVSAPTAQPAPKSTVTPQAAADAGAEPEDDEEAARLRAVEAFAAGRAKGGDPTQLLAVLEEELGVGSDDEGDEPELPAPDFPGVVGAMIDEMRWELSATRPGFDTATLEPLKHLATFAKPIGIFEELRGHDLFQFATFWLQEKGVLESDAEGVRLVHALRVFCEWALDAHEVDLGSEFLDALDGLETSLPRMRHANAALAAGDRARGLEDTGDLLEVLALDEGSPTEFEASDDRVRTSSGDILTVVFAKELRGHLRPGDRVRGHVDLEGLAHVYCCYPPEAAALSPH